MNFRSVSDLGSSIRANLSKLPSDVDLVVGVPRGGALAGTMIALSLNVPYLDLDAYLRRQKPRHGFTREPKSKAADRADSKHVLVVDDRIESGETMRQVMRMIEAVPEGGKVSCCAVYGSNSGLKQVDYCLEVVDGPLYFQWNLSRSGILAECCIDIDGVLCKDPTRDQNDGDGPAYLKFLKVALPLSFPSHEIGYLVTSRLERYRSQTEEWLARQGIQYKALHMLDLPDALTRGRLKAQAPFKSEIFMSYPAAPLFVESCRNQAFEIARISRRPVLCIDEHRLFTADSQPPPPAPARRSRPARLLGFAKKVVSEFSSGRVRQWNSRLMQYRSYNDLARAVTCNLHKIPRDVDLVVGIPRSGLLAGTLIALSKNIPLIDLDGFVSNRTSDCGFAAKGVLPALPPQEAKHVLVVDDSIYRGDSMALARELLGDSSKDRQVTYCAVYANPRSHHMVDIHFELLESPGCQEWNFLHRDKAADFCLEMDGVLCEAPSGDRVRNLDEYRRFCSSARMLFQPSYRVGWIVTARPESVRKETELWLEANGIKYQGLYMAPGYEPSTGQQACKEIVRFKSSIYASKRRSLLFVEGDSTNAKAIAALSGKTVLSFGEQNLYNPELSKKQFNEIAIRIRSKVERRLRRIQSPRVAM